jgi:hypothetical protein
MGKWTTKFFKHWTAITIDLRDAGIKEIELANVWQEGFLKSKELGYLNKNFAWLLFKSKYYYDKVKNDWTELVPTARFPREQMKSMLSREIMGLLFETLRFDRLNCSEHISAMKKVLHNLEIIMFEAECEAREIANEKIKKEVKTEEVPTENIEEIKVENKEEENSKVEDNKEEGIERRKIPTEDDQQSSEE